MNKYLFSRFTVKATDASAAKKNFKGKPRRYRMPANETTTVLSHRRIVIVLIICRKGVAFVGIRYTSKHAEEVRVNTKHRDT